MAGQVHPTAVVEGSPTPLVVGDPDVVGRVAVRPVTRRHVRLEVGADFGRRGDPHGAVRRILNPRAVTFERGLELGERARIGVRVLVGILSDQDLTRVLRFLRACLLLRAELGRCGRRWRNVLLLRVVRFVDR